jgi:hypothetical protein
VGSELAHTMIMLSDSQITVRKLEECVRTLAQLDQQLLLAPAPATIETKIDELRAELLDELAYARYLARQDELD